MGANEMAQQVKFPAAKPGEQNIVPRTHMVKREKWILQVVLCSLPRSHSNYTCTQYI